MPKKIKPGNVVSTDKHSHLMTVHELLPNNKAICLYFIGTELYTETHDLESLTFISD